MKSIRRSLVLGIWSSTGLLLVAAGCFIFLATRAMLLAQFDATLAAKAQALIAASEVDGKNLEFDFTVENFAGFGRTDGGDYFEIRQADGSVVTASPSLGNLNLPALQTPGPGKTKVRSIRLPDGSAGRALVKTFRPEDDDKARFTDVHIVVASRTASLQQSLTILGLVLAVSMSTAAALTGPLARLVLAKGLRPLDQLNHQLRQLKPDAPNQQIAQSGLPEELTDVAASINTMLTRVHASIERERRFSSHAAHELRTPLAELKSIVEMSLCWPQENPADRYAEILAITLELETLLDKLSLLARADAGRIACKPESIEPANFLVHALSRFEALISGRGLVFETKTSDTPIMADPVLLGTILTNLISNAASHAPGHGTIRITLGPGHLHVENHAPELSKDDVPRLFERFWRKNTAREDCSHSGLGLSIVDSCASVMGATCRAELSPSGTLGIHITWPA